MKVGFYCGAYLDAPLVASDRDEAPTCEHEWEAEVDPEDAEAYGLPLVAYDTCPKCGSTVEAVVSAQSSERGLK